MGWHTDVSSEAKETMKALGDFTPTAHPQAREVKGYTYDENGEGCKTYWNSGDLRKMAAHLIEVADWLDRNAG